MEQYEFLLNEIEIMKQLDHPNIARFVSDHEGRGNRSYSLALFAHAWAWL